MRFLALTDELLAKLEGWLIVLLLWIMIAATFIQVALRSLYTHAHLNWANLLLGHIDWAEPLARILVLWLTFLGASLVTREGKHIKIDLLEVVLPRGWHPFREMLLALLAALLTTLLLAASLAFIRMEMSYGGHVLSVVPIWVSQAIIPIGFAFMTFRFALRGLLEIVAIRRSRRP